MNIHVITEKQTVPKKLQFFRKITETLQKKNIISFLHVVKR